MRTLLLPLLGLSLAGLTQAQITTVTTPFTGDRFEGFETQNSPGFNPCIIGRVFQNTAELCTPGSMGTHITGGWSFRCQLAPQAGTRLYGSAGGVSRFTFDAPVQGFGGYLATNSWNLGQAATETVTVNFYDDMGGLIGTEIADVTDDCTWTWNGWTSTVGIKEIELINSVFGGAFVQMDSMEVLDSTFVGNVYCNSNPNSMGVEASLEGSGSASLASNNLQLDASDMPLQAFGFLLASQNAASTPNPGGSAGVLCLGGMIGRYVGPNQIQNTGTTGEFSLAVDLTTMPQPNGSLAAAVGDTWHFQAWFRDSMMGTATSNFTNGLEVVITP